MSKTFGVTTQISQTLPEDFREIAKTQAADSLSWQAAQQGYAVVGPIKHLFRDELFIDEITGETYDIFTLYSWAEVSSIVEMAEGMLSDD